LQQAHAQERVADVLNELDAGTEAFDAAAAYHGPWWAMPAPPWTTSSPRCSA